MRRNRRDAGDAEGFFQTYPERLVDLGGLVVTVGVGCVRSSCPRQLPGDLACPLSCGEHFGRPGVVNCCWS